MSIEEPIELTEEEKVAWDLLNEDPLLSRDSYAKRVLKSGGVADNGEKVDIGDFLAARQAVLEMNQAEGKVAAAKNKNSQAWGLAYSVRPDLEEK